MKDVDSITQQYYTDLEEEEISRGLKEFGRICNDIWNGNRGSNQDNTEQKKKLRGF
jgi:hypothetical protein